MKTKLLDLDFDSLEDIDLIGFSKEFDSILRHNIYNATDIDKVKSIYHSLI